MAIENTCLCSGALVRLPIVVSCLFALIGCDGSPDAGESKSLTRHGANGRRMDVNCAGDESEGRKSDLKDTQTVEWRVTEIVGKLTPPIKAEDHGKLVKLMRELAETDHALLTKLISGVPAEAAVSILANDPVFNGYICANSKQVLALLDSTPWKTGNCGEVKRIVDAMTTVRSREVVTWLAGKQITPFVGELVQSVFSKVALRPDLKEDSLVRLLESGELRESALRGMVQIYAVTDSPKLVAIMENEDDATKARLLPSVVRFMSIERPSEAWDYVTSNGKTVPVEVVAECAQTIGQHFLRNGQESVQSWIDSIDDEYVRSVAVKGVMKTWCANDIVTASEWLSKQALGPARDAGAKVLIEQIKDTDPEMAEQWRKSLTSPAGK